jgi:predicted enzyme related to lactoylglutathione lyase
VPPRPDRSDPAGAGRPAYDALVGNPVVYFEIGCRERAATSSFYSELFDWKIRADEHSDVVSAGSDVGIDGHIASLGHEPHNYTIFYVSVDDLEASIERAEELGGSRLVGPVVIPDGRFAWITDPEGNTVGLLQSSSSS